MDTIDSKPTNPKDAIGTTKLPSTVVPSVVSMYAALAFTEGATKYGAHNWAVAGVRCSIYLDAIDRHLKKFTAGEWADPKTKVPHLASVIASVGIILDAHHRGMMIDDRPPAAPHIPPLIDSMEATVIHLKELFKDHTPHQHTIEDDRNADQGIDRRLLQTVPLQPQGKEGSGSA